MITWILTTILSIIVGIFIIHFIGLWISNKIRSKFPGWGIKLGKRFEISITSDKSLMVDINQYEEWYLNEESINGDQYSHNITLIIGGFYLKFKYGHTPLKNDDYLCDLCKTKYFGLYSIDGEKWWRSIWWNKHLYDNPFTCSHFMGCWVLDVENGKLINKKIITHYEKEYDETINFPYYATFYNVPYINKNGKEQIVPMIQWWYEIRKWCPPILNKLGLSWLYNKDVVDFTFDISQNGSNDFHGIGINVNDWKGGVYGSSIIINKNYPELYNMFKSITKGQVGLLSRFKYLTDNLINDFMLYQKKY